MWLDKPHVAYCANTQSTGVGHLPHDRVNSFSRACSDDMGVRLPDGALARQQIRPTRADVKLVWLTLFSPGRATICN